MCLDVRKSVIAHQILSRGTIDEAPVYPRMVAEAALRHHAACVILVHNHPSGQLKPSQHDHAVSAQIAEALKTLEIQLMDHIIVAGPNAMSLFENGAHHRDSKPQPHSILPLHQKEYPAAADKKESELL